MSYGVSAALQSAVYQAMVADPDISALVGSHIFDALPSGTLPDTYISLGPEIVQDRSDMTGVGADHSFTISVVSVVSGFASTKVVAGAVCDLLHQADLTLDRGALVSMVIPAVSIYVLWRVLRTTEFNLDPRGGFNFDIGEELWLLRMVKIC